MHASVIEFQICSQSGGNQWVTESERETIQLIELVKPTGLFLFDCVTPLRPTKIAVDAASAAKRFHKIAASVFAANRSSPNSQFCVSAKHVCTRKITLLECQQFDKKFKPIRSINCLTLLNSDYSKPLFTAHSLSCRTASPVLLGKSSSLSSSSGPLPRAFGAIRNEISSATN